ncbi:DUF58 domain-containing protein [Halomicrobium sp. HM KBTZ05]|uniref:DUF58 domain-containing protein n=1 Tax=Halomicrobium sp. HM KBTZ05 TaxID=3242663 RepID=UPI003557D3AF
MSRGRLLAAVGLVAFAVGVGALVAPGVFGLGIQRYAVVVIGLLAVAAALRVVQGRRHAPRRRAETAMPEAVPAVPSPGEELDAVLAAFDPTRYGTADRRRKQLRRVATEVLTRYRGDSEATAREAIERGTWTDDPVAAGFLADERSRPPLTDRLRTRLGGASPYWQGIERTVRAIAETAGVDTDDRDGSTRPGLDPIVGSLDGRDAGLDRASAVADPTPTTRSTGHWRGISAAALSALGVGVLAERAGVVLVAVVGIAYAAAARKRPLSAPPLSIERTVEPADPEPDETVTVTLTVTNEGEGPVWDLRLVDGVPPALSVVEGSPRLGTALWPGASATITYEVATRRGRHEFGHAQVLVRTLSGSVERELAVEPETATELTCVPPLRPIEEPVPLRRQPTRHTGRVETATGGEGVEFFATRAYRSGDPLSRIDWNRHARTGDLATLEFREERAATVVLVIDRDEAAAVGPSRRGQTAVQRSVDAASRLFTTLLDDGNRVGIAALGARDCWLAPGAGDAHRVRARELLATHPALAPGETPESVLPFGWLASLRSQLPGDAQVVLLSPLCSPAVATVARQLDAGGHLVTVVSPDPTTTASGAGQLATVARRFRIADLRAAGIPVVDWPWEQSLPVALARTGWSE